MSETITYGRLEQALIQLGFSKQLGPGYIVFHNDDHDATFVLPNISPSEKVRDVHLIAARQTIVGKGVADTRTFWQLLMPAGSIVIDEDADIEVIPDRTSDGHELDVNARQASSLRKRGRYKLRTHVLPH